jgi:rod shape-determining protein MreC
MRILSARWKPIALFLCLILCALLLTTVRTRMASRTSFVEALMLSIVMPLQEAINGITQSISDLWNGYINLLQVRSENLRLRRQLAELQGELHRYREAYLQQQRLRDLLGFRSAVFPNPVAAEVVGIDPSQWAEAVAINKGSRDRVEVKPAVDLAKLEEVLVLIP